MERLERRKDEQLEINSTRDVNSGITTGFENYFFIHQALPDANLEEISTSSVFMNHPLKIPLLISSMTGGTEKGELINRRLAEAAQQAGIAMGVGSQRAELENPASQDRSSLRAYAPDIPIFANLGAIQLNYGYTVAECKRAVEIAGADALILHLNPLQESLQPEGQTNFEGLAERIGLVCKQMSVPVIVKEVGWGISAATAKLLIELGVAAIDVAGAGGTSWSEVEKYRSQDQIHFEIAETFKNWGIPTAECVKEVRSALPGIPLIASGGVHSGLDLAKSIALGADLAGIARPFLLAAQQSTEAVISKIEQLKRELMITMFVAGARDISSLSNLTLRRR